MMGVSSLAAIFRPLETEKRTCAKHGDYEACLFRIPGTNNQRWTECLECQKEKTTQEDARLSENARQEMIRREAEAVLGRAAIPKRFIGRKLDNYRVENEGQKKALASAMRYAENWQDNRDNGVNLILTGHPGTGKTHLAVGIAHHVMSRGGSALYTRVVEVVRAVKDTYSDKTKTERQVIDEFRKPDLLIMDEVGRQMGTDTEKLVLFEVINARYEDCKPTILIANLQVGQLAEYLDPAALDRLREGGGRVVIFDWDSERSKV